MAEISLARTWTTAAPFARLEWHDRLFRRVRALRRRARRNRYLVLIGRGPRRVDWVAEMSRAIGGRL